MGAYKVSDETRKKMSESAKRKFARMTDEEKAEYSKKFSKIRKAKWDSLSEEEKAYQIARRKEGYDNMPESSRLSLSTKLSTKAHQRWANMSDSQREEMRGVCSKAGKTYWDNIDEEEYILRQQRMRDTANKFWANMTQDQFIEWDKQKTSGYNKIAIIDNNEIVFAKMLDDYHLSYISHWYNEQIHPDFYNRFGYNPVLKTDRVSPYHEWDFRIETADHVYLVDVDGSVHDPNKTNYFVTYVNGHRFKLKDHIEFNDSKRICQNDGFVAYSIRCYDDKLTMNTAVCNIMSGELMSVKLLLDLMSFDNLPEDFKRDIGKNISKN